MYSRLIFLPHQRIIKVSHVNMLQEVGFFFFCIFTFNTICFIDSGKELPTDAVLDNVGYINVTNTQKI